MKRALEQSWKVKDFLKPSKPLIDSGRVGRVFQEKKKKFGLGIPQVRISGGEG